MVLPFAAVGALLEKGAAIIAVVTGVGAVAVAAPELCASDQRGAREMDDDAPAPSFPPLPPRLVPRSGAAAAAGEAATTPLKDE
jgi:hypothetical protein